MRNDDDDNGDEDNGDIDDDGDVEDDNNGDNDVIKCLFKHLKAPLVRVFNDNKQSTIFFTSAKFSR